MKTMPSLPINPNFISIHLSNRILKEEEFNNICSKPYMQVKIYYEGDSYSLDMLMQQLAPFKTNNIKLYISKCFIDYNVCLPFHYLGNNVKIEFSDNVEYGSGFNDYLMNCNDVVFNQAMSKLFDEKEKTRIIQEKNIREEFLNYILSELDRRNIDISKWDNKKKMDFFYKIIKDNYPYDWSITNNGHYIPESTIKGGTALVVYQRGRGICEGRSKLLKVVTNNNTIKLPCYLVDGRLGVDGHMWNEIITEDGNILEYDLSTGIKCSLQELENLHHSHKILAHESNVEKVLKKC